MQTTPFRFRPLVLVWRALLAVVNWSVAILGLCAILSALALASPSLAHALPWTAAMAALAIALGFVSYRRPRAPLHRFVLIPIFLGCAALVSPDMLGFLGMKLAPPDAPGRIRLVELNVWDANSDPARTIAWLRQTDADVILLAEARESFIRDLSGAFPDYPTFITCAGRPYCGVVILSRFPGSVLAGGRLVADGLQHPAGRDADLAVAAAELRIPASDGRTLPTPVVAIHLDRRGFSSVSETQIDLALDAVKAAAGRHGDALVLGGDFNASPWSPQLQRFAAALGAPRVSLFTPTWPARLAGLPPVLAIDHVYLGCSWRAAQMQAGPFVGSDHRPLMTTFFPAPADAKTCAGG